MEETSIGNITVIRGDCMEYMRSLDAGAAAPPFGLAVVDPPYGPMGSRRKGGQWAARYGSEVLGWDSAPPGEYFALLSRVSRHQVIWGGNYFSGTLGPARCFLVWDKKNIPEGFTMAMCEMAWTSFNANARIFRHVPQNPPSEPRIHPTQKPVALYSWILGMFAAPGMTVLDTHMGSGSSAIAVYEANRSLLADGLEPIRYTGVEISDMYCGRAVERIRRHMAEHPYGEGGGS